MDKAYYLSVSSAGAEKGVSEKTVRKYIKEKDNWNYYKSLTEKQKKEILLFNKKEKLQQRLFKVERGVKVGEEEFPSIRKAASAHKIDPSSIKKCIKSRNFPNWKWADS